MIDYIIVRCNNRQDANILIHYQRMLAQPQNRSIACQHSCEKAVYKICSKCLRKVKEKKTLNSFQATHDYKQSSVKIGFDIKSSLAMQCITLLKKTGVCSA